MSRGILKMRGALGIQIVGSVAGNVSTAEGQTHALGNIDVGPTSTDKTAIMLITWEDNNTQTITSLTVGGVSLTQRATATASAGRDVAAEIWTGDISSKNGSQAISVTFSSGIDSVGISGVAVSGLQSETPTMSDGDSTTASAQLTITNLAAKVGGIAVACGCSADRASSATWSSLTEKADVQTGSGSPDHRHTAAWDLGAHTAANETLDFSSGTERAAIGAGFR